jgi:hypothetical protein
MSQNPRVALVTGASAGIGQACAGLLSRAGWAVTGASRRGTASAGWQGLVMDVDDDASVRDGVRHVLLAHGRIDAVVAAAGWGNVRTDFTASRRLAGMDGEAGGEGGAGAAAGDPVYGAAVAKAVGLMERDERNGVPPDDIAVAVGRFSAPDGRRGGSRPARPASAWPSWPSGSCPTGCSRPGPRAAWASADPLGAG